MKRYVVQQQDAAVEARLEWSLAADLGVGRTESGGDLKPRWLRVIGIMPAAAAMVMLAYRIDVAVGVSRLARSGAREEALLALLVDPLWRLEFAVARAIGDP